MGQNITNDDTLLIEGARSYLQATSAIVHYQHEIQKRCHRVMSTCLGEYASALGIGLKESDLKDFAWPEAKLWEEGYAHVGVWLSKRRFLGIRWWDAFVYLEWQAEDPKFSCGISECFHSRKLTIALYDRFRRMNAKDLWIEDREVGICRSVTPEEAAGFEDLLEDVLVQWIKLWKKVGGMKKFFKGSNG